MKTRKFYVSGVIQIEVYADDEESALQRAEERARNLEKRSPSLVIGIDADTVEEKT